MLAGTGRGLPRARTNARRQRQRTLLNVIGYLKGHARGHDLVDVNGVGYQVHCATPLTDGAAVELYVSTHVRDDKIVLYGFTSLADKAMYESLVKVNGVGPASALGLLGQLGADGIAAAITSQNTAALAQAKGIGKKTAQAIVAFCVVPDGARGNPQVADLVSALISLGFDPHQAQVSADRAIHLDPDADEATLLASALRNAGTSRTKVSP